MSLSLYSTSYSSLTTILQCCSELCHLQHGQQAFFRQNAAPSQIETHLRLKVARNEQGSQDRFVIRFGSLKLILRYRLGAVSRCTSPNKAITRLVYIQVMYHYLKQSLLHEGESMTLFKSSCKNNPTTSLETFTRYLKFTLGGAQQCRALRDLALGLQECLLDVDLLYRPLSCLLRSRRVSLSNPPAIRVNMPARQ